MKEREQNWNNLAITGLIKKFALIQPTQIALIIDDNRINYGEFYRQICSASIFLQRVGVKKGTRVVTVASPNLQYIVCEYAILGLGAVNIPTENRIPADRLGTIAKAVDAELVLSTVKPECDIKWISYDVIDRKGMADFAWNPVGISDECSEIVFTTGTTGKSKGVMLSSRCLDTYLKAINPTFKLVNNSVFLVTTPLNHVGGLHRIHQCMSVGCTAVILDGIKDLKSFFHSIEVYGVTHTYLPPASVKMLLALAKKNLALLDGKLQFIYTASAPFPMKDIETLMEILPHTRLHQGYGSSETGSICNCCYNAPGNTVNSLGKPYDCVEVVLHDENGTVITEPYKEGLISSRSKMNMLGYYKEPELTTEVLKDGFIYSHDLMFFDEKGELHFAGRGDDVINIRGFKVTPTEVEDVALRYETIAECACVPFEDKVYGRVLKMFVVMKEGHVFNIEDITLYLETKLEAYKLPKYIECISEIPKTYNGKIDRKRLVNKTD